MIHLWSPIIELLIIIQCKCKYYWILIFRIFIYFIFPIFSYSGISEESLKNVTRTIRDVQAVLLSMFHSKTILIGHSLDSDFKALKLVHDVVVDTSVLYPHKMGLPKKRALKTLCIENLKRIIQENGKCFRLIYIPINVFIIFKIRMKCVLLQVNYIYCICIASTPNVAFKLINYSFRIRLYNILSVFLNKKRECSFCFCCC